MADITLALGEQGADPARLDLLTRQLRDELGRLILADTRLGDTLPAPPGTRGLDAATVSTLAVTMLGSGGLAALVTAARAWVDRGHAVPRTIRVEVGGDVLELSGASADEHERLVSVFLTRHGE